MLQEGTLAPDFTLPDKDGNPVTLSSLRGKKVVLYFYPKDNTPAARVRRRPMPPSTMNLPPRTPSSSA